jgi:DNA-binding protein HU-beta
MSRHVPLCPPFGGGHEPLALDRGSLQDHSKGEEAQMTKAELVETVAHATRQPKKIVATTIDLTFDQIARAIRKDKRFWVPDFGTFSLRRRKARAGFNPRTNTAMTIPAARTIGFRPAPKLKKGL